MRIPTEKDPHLQKSEVQERIADGKVKHTQWTSAKVKEREKILRMITGRGERIKPGRHAGV